MPPHTVAVVAPAPTATCKIFLEGRDNLRHLGKFCELNLKIIFVKVWLLRKFDPYEQNIFPRRRRDIVAALLTTAHQPRHNIISFTLA